MTTLLQAQHTDFSILRALLAFEPLIKFLLEASTPDISEFNLLTWTFLFTLLVMFIYSLFSPRLQLFKLNYTFVCYYYYHRTSNPSFCSRNGQHLRHGWLLGQSGEHSNYIINNFQGQLCSSAHHPPTTHIYGFYIESLIAKASV